jgi:capsid protein
MSRSRKAKARLSLTGGVASQPPQPLAMSGYQAANWSPQRGYVYWPTLDPAKEITAYSRRETARKVHFLHANVGLPRRLIDGVANLIVGGGLSPQASTKDTAWNELAEKSYRRRARSPFTFDRRGELTDVQMQRLVTKTMFKDGDAAVVFTKSEAGGALRTIYSGHAIGDLPRGNPAEAKDWSDGIRRDSLGRRLAFRFPQENGRAIDIPAVNVRFLMRHDSPGQNRGISALAHAVNKMIDLTELNAAVMQGIKSSAQIGYYLFKAPGTNAPSTIGSRITGQGQKVAVETAQGPINLRAVYGTGGEIPELPPGVELKQLLDQRPHPNVRDFAEDFIRDISWGTGISSDLLWNIYKLGGANVRYIMADAQVFISTEQQNLIDNWLAPDWVYHCACEMKAGRLRPCLDPEWWTHFWVPPARVTVDFGRDGKIYLEMHRAGLLSAERFLSMEGKDAREETTKHLDFVAWRNGELEARGLTLADAYPGMDNGAPAEKEKGEKGTKREENNDEEKSDLEAEARALTVQLAREDLDGEALSCLELRLEQIEARLAS